MALPRSIVIPAALALVVAAVLGGGLFWQLDRTRALLTGAQNPETTLTMGMRPIAALPSPLLRGDAALTALRAGDLLALRGEWREAKQEYEAAVQAGGGLTALRKLAQAQLQVRDIDGVRTTIGALRAAGARDEDLLLLESVIELRQNEFGDVKTRLDAAADSPQKHYGLSLLAIAEGRHDDAKAALTQVLTGWEPTLRSYAKTLQAAYDEYALFPKSPEIHRETLLARALADVQECELAIPLLTDVLTEEEDYRDAWIVRGFCELTTERLEEAKTSLERAYALDPQKPEISYFLGRTHARMGNHPAAITSLTYAIENGFEPRADARRLLAAEALASGDSARALQELNLVTSEPGATVDAFADFVTAAIAAEKKEEAYARAQAATTAFPEEARSYELLGRAAAALEKEDEARTALTRALELDANLDSARELLESL